MRGDVLNERAVGPNGVPVQALLVLHQGAGNAGQIQVLDQVIELLKQGEKDGLMPPVYLLEKTGGKSGDFRRGKHD